jgi:hypothetical protein
MPEMSADVERSQIAAVATLGPQPSVAPTPPRATAEHPATVAPANGSPVKPLLSADPLADTPDHPHWRLAALGYGLLTAGFILALTLPHFHVHAGLREDALVILSIATMLTGSTAVLASFVLNLLRQP